MSLIEPTTAPVDVPLSALHLSALHRFRLRGLLQDRWLRHVQQLTELAVRFHSDEEEEPAGDRRAELGSRLADVRWQLAEVEAAMRRLDSGSYGRCEGCGAAIDPKLLSGCPERRCCERCPAA